MAKVFTNTLKTYTSDITGEERKYKVNNAVFLYLDSEFGLDQDTFDQLLEGNGLLAMAKFVTAVLLANGVDTDYEEVMNNTAARDIIKFYSDFFDKLYGRDLDSQVEEAEEKRQVRQAILNEANQLADESE